MYKEQLNREQRFLRRRLEQLINPPNPHDDFARLQEPLVVPTSAIAAAAALAKRRSISESSLGTVSTSSSSSSGSSNSDRSAGSPSISESGKYRDEIVVDIKPRVCSFRWNVFTSRNFPFCLVSPRNYRAYAEKCVDFMFYEFQKILMLY